MAFASTDKLAMAVTSAGGFGFIAAGTLIHSFSSIGSKQPQALTRQQS